MAIEPTPPTYDSAKIKTPFAQSQEISAIGNGTMLSCKITNFSDVKKFRGDGQASPPTSEAQTQQEF